jgi:hypothetical protein
VSELKVVIANRADLVEVEDIVQQVINIFMGYALVSNVPGTEGVARILTFKFETDYWLQEAAIKVRNWRNRTGFKCIDVFCLGLGEKSCPPN